MLKKKIFLILSPIRSTYPENYKGTIIFLGNKDYQYIKKKNPKAIIEKISTVWSDKEKLFLDNRYLSNLENIFFKKIGSLIDKKNGTNNDNKYWSIFLRPTVFAILTTLYERWLKIQHVIKNYEIENCKFLNSKIEDFISIDSDDFYKKIYFEDYFNQIIFQDILENHNFKFQKFEFNIKTAKDNEKYKPKLFFYIKKIKISNILYLLNLIYEKIKNFFFLLSIKKKNFTYIAHHIKNSELRQELNSFFKQKNFIFKIKNCKNKNPLDINFRNDLKESLIFQTENKFEKFFQTYIFKILPKHFVENFKIIQKNNLSIVKNFKFNYGIILYDQLFGNDFCELDWIAKNYMNGSKLLLAQNGGGQITAECTTIKSMMQNFEFKKLTFGIEDEVKDNTYGVGIYRFNKQKSTFKKDGKIIYALYTPYGYSGIIRSNQPIGDEWVEYMKTHEEFLDLLNPEIQKEIILRPKKRHKDYFNFKERLKKKFPNTILEQHGSKPLKDVLVNARLLITTLDTTTILESLASNFPTILICDLKKFHIASKFLPYYKTLYDAGILFYNPQEAKNHIEKIFSDVENWWKKADVQKARERFCKKFAYHPENQNLYFVNKLSKINL